MQGPLAPRPPHRLPHPHLRTSIAVFLLAATSLPAEQFGDFTYSSDGASVTITGHTGAGGQVDIPGTITGLPVTEIGGYVFYFNKSVTNITMGGHLHTIGGGAFEGCSKLVSITFGPGVTTIRESAFSATGQTSVTIPDSVTSIGFMTFHFTMPSLPIPVSRPCCGTRHSARPPLPTGFRP